MNYVEFVMTPDDAGQSSAMSEMIMLQSAGGIAHAPRNKQFAGFQTGDIVRAIIPTGKSAGKHTGRIAIRHRPSFVLKTETTKHDVHPKYLTKLHQADGYAYY